MVIKTIFKKQMVIYQIIVPIIIYKSIMILNTHQSIMIDFMEFHGQANIYR